MSPELLDILTELIAELREMANTAEQHGVIHLKPRFAEGYREAADAVATLIGLVPPPSSEP